MTLSEALIAFETVGMPARNLAARTRIEYQNDIQAFFDFLAKSQVNRIGELATVHIDRYLASLGERGYAGSTRKRKAITLRAFLLFLYRNGHITNDISRKIIIPFADTTTPYFLTQNEYQQLLDAAADNPRDSALITLLLQTGIRLSELCRLTISDVDIASDGQGGRLRVHAGSRRKDREVPLNAKTRQALLRYLSERLEAPQKALFINRSSKPLGGRGVQKIVTKYLKIAGLPGISVHTLRHTFATHHVIKGTALKSLQEVMGHRDIRTTESYLPIANELARKELEDNSLQT